MPIDLLARGQRQCIDDLYAFRELVRGESRRREVAEVGERRRTVRVPRDDDRDTDLAHHVVGPGHDRDRRDVGMGREHALDLDRVDVVAAAYVHLLAATDEAQAAAVVDPAEVAGADEAVGSERGPRLLGVAPVARHHCGGAQADLADLVRGDVAALRVADCEIDARVRPPDADDRVLLGIVECGAETDAGFRARVARRERGAEATACLLGETGRDRSAARDDVLHRRQVEAIELGIAQHQRELRRYAGDDRHALAGQQLERGACSPPLHDEGRAAAAERARELRHEAEVRERRAAERTSAAVPSVADVGLGDERELAVAVQRALRRSRSCPT